MATNQFAELFAGLAPKGDWYKPPQLGNKTTAPPGTPPGMVGMSTPQGPKFAPLVAASPSATTPAPAPITPPQSPAKQQFIDNSLKTPTTNQPQEYGASVTDTQGRSGTAKFDSMTGAALEKPADPARDAFEAYYKSLAMPDDLKKTNSALADVNSTIFGKELSSRREYTAALDAPGMLKSGAQESASRVSRMNNAELADLAVQQNALANTSNAQLGQYNAMSAGEKARFDFEKGLTDEATKANAPFDLSEGQSRYVLNKKTGKYEAIASKAKTYAPSSSGVLPPGFNGTLSPLAQAVQNGTIALDKVPAAQRAQVAAELATSGIQSPRQQALESSLDVVNSLMNMDTNAITGIGQNPLNAVGLTNSLAINTYDQLKGILSLENREKLKGSGAISDFEFKVLQQAASALGRNLSNEDFKATLQKIKDVFEGKYRNTTATGGTAPAASTGASNSDPLGLGI